MQDTHPALAVLREFQSSMQDWEKRYHDIFSQLERDVAVDQDNARKELQIIYGQHVTQRERKTGRLAHPHAGFPSEFSPERETLQNIEETENGKAVIAMRWHDGISDDYYEDRRYTLLLKNGQWRLDKLQFYSDYRQRWENRTL